MAQPSFDLEAARKAGYSDQEIQQYLLSLPGSGKAKAAGYSDQEILSHFGFPAAVGPATAPEVSVTSPTGESVAPAPQVTGIARWPALLGSAILKGGAITAGLPGDIEQLADKYVYNPLDQALGGKGVPLDQTINFTSEQALQPLRQLGLVDQAALMPQTPAEKLATGAATGLGEAIPTLPFMGAGAALPTLAAGAAGGAASVLAPNDPLAQVAAGALAGGGAAGVASLAQRGINAIRGNVTPEMADFATAGIPVRSAALTSSSPETLAKLGPSAPLVQTQQDLGQAIEARAASLGASRTFEDAGKAAQDDARRYLAPLPQDPALRSAEIANPTTLDGKVARAWAPVDIKVPDATPGSLANMYTALTDMTTRGGSLQDLVNELSPKLPSRLIKILNNQGAAPTWGEMQQLRSALGDAMKNPQVVKDIPADQLARLYASLTSDMRGVTLGLDAANPQLGATAAFDAANAESQRLYSFAEHTLGKVVAGARPSAEDPNPENVAKNLLAASRVGGSDLAALRREMPDTANELAAVHLRQLGLEDPTDPGSTVSGKFAGKWAGVSPEAKAALLPNQDDQAALEASARIANRTKLAAKPPVASDHTAVTILGGAGGALAEFLGSHFLPGLIPGGTAPLLLSEAAGTAVGYALPAVRQAIRQRIAANALLAHLAGARGSLVNPRWFTTVGAGSALGNALNPAPSPQ